MNQTGRRGRLPRSALAREESAAVVLAENVAEDQAAGARLDRRSSWERGEVRAYPIADLIRASRAAGLASGSGGAAVAIAAEVWTNGVRLEEIGAAFEVARPIDDVADADDHVDLLAAKSLERTARMSSSAWTSPMTPTRSTRSRPPTAIPRRLKGVRAGHRSEVYAAATIGTCLSDEYRMPASNGAR